MAFDNTDACLLLPGLVSDCPEPPPTPPTMLVRMSRACESPSPPPSPHLDSRDPSPTLASWPDDAVDEAPSRLLVGTEVDAFSVSPDHVRDGSAAKAVDSPVLGFAPTTEKVSLLADVTTPMGWRSAKPVLVNEEVPEGGVDFGVGEDSAYGGEEFEGSPVDNDDSG